MPADFQTPRALRHYKSFAAFSSSWQKIQRTIAAPRVLAGLPPFVRRLAEVFWETAPHDAEMAVRRGDCAFFVAFQLRLDQIDCAMVNAGLGLGDRAPVTRAKWLMEGFRLAAEDRLIKRGGHWPPTVDEPPEESSDPENQTESPHRRSDGSHPSRGEPA